MLFPLSTENDGNVDVSFTSIQAENLSINLALKCCRRVLTFVLIVPFPDQLTFSVLWVQYNLESFCSVWSPQYKDEIKKVEIVQRQANR